MNNSIDIVQSGYGNQSYISQLGNTNLVDIHQSADLGYVEIIQDGNNNQVMLDQLNTGQFITIHQIGSNIVTEMWQ